MSVTTLNAAEWTIDFESAEGFAPGANPAGSPVSVIGGDVIIAEGLAAQGTQFLRYVPRSAENALVIKMPGEVASGTDRALQFAVRLVGETEPARLVLSSGQTIGLQPVAGGVLVDVGGARRTSVSVDESGGGWLEIGLHESATAGTWDLSIGGQVLAVDLSLLDDGGIPGDLLIFADGALDLDAIRAATFASDALELAEVGGTVPTNELTGGPGTDAGDSVATESLPGDAKVPTDREILDLLADASDRRALAEIRLRRNGTIPDHVLIARAMRRIRTGDVDAAWAWLTLDREAYAANPTQLAEVVGRRAAVVTAFLNNTSEYKLAAAFANAVVDRTELEVAAEPASRRKGQALYWRARLANEISDRKSDAVRWARAATEYDGGSSEAQALKRSLEGAIKRFPELVDASLSAGGTAQ